MKRLITAIIAALVACTVSGIAAENARSDRPILTPDVRVANGARSFGVKVDLVSLARAKRPTKTVYVEEAVALWRPAYGEQIAAAGNVEAADVNAAVATKETVVEKGVMESLSDHFKRNSGKYTASAILALVGGAAWYLYDDAQSDGDMQARASIPSQQSPTGSQSPAIVVSGVNLAPGATININIDQPYASE